LKNKIATNIKYYELELLFAVCEVKYIEDTCGEL